MKSRKTFFIWLIIVVVTVLSVMNVMADQGTYTVKSGDTVSAIARAHGVTTLALIQANNLSNPNFIVSGQELIIPDLPATPVGFRPTPVGSYIVHVVQPGDTTYTIALQYGVTMDAIVEANRLENFRVVRIGQQLFVPGVVGTPTPTRQPSVAVTTPGVSTPVPPAAAPASPGVNLFPNPSFENSIYDHNGIQELQVPQGWFIYVDEGLNDLVPGSGGNFFRPESRIFATANIPDAEIPLYVWNGIKAIKVFKGVRLLILVSSLMSLCSRELIRPLSVSLPMLFWGMKVVPKFGLPIRSQPNIALFMVQVVVIGRPPRLVKRTRLPTPLRFPVQELFVSGLVFATDMLVPIMAG
ncbi:MAG: LysM peptidoglycan-binding domain-containing protein [Chloroflexi bacterium]|nr:LysM peptidoglycan-binding domain-containing protein [Chloroflexota bacterium]